MINAPTGRLGLKTLSLRTGKTALPVLQLPYCPSFSPHVGGYVSEASDRGEQGQARAVGSKHNRCDNGKVKHRW